jgi:hypothetical protein
LPNSPATFRSLCRGCPPSASSLEAKNGHGRINIANPTAPTTINGMKNIAGPDFCPRVQILFRSRDFLTKRK